jgi:hypothetical protein
MSGHRFEAGPVFIGRKVSVRFDPFDLRAVLVIADSGESVTAYPVDLAANRRVRRLPPTETSQATPPPLRSLEQLAEDMKQSPHDDQDDDHDGEAACVS